MVRTTLLCLTIFCVAFIVHLSALHNGLMYDDLRILHIDLPRLNNFLDPFSNRDLFSRQGNYFRPIMWGYFMLVRDLWGSHQSIYHFLSLVIHALNSVLVFLVSKKILNHARVWNSRIIAFFAGLIFAVHPVHVEVVGWIACSVELLLTLFSLLSFLFYFYYRESRNVFLGLISSLFFFLALCSKETAVMMLCAYLACDILFFKGTYANIFSKAFSFVKNYAWYLVVLIAYMVLRQDALVGSKLGTFYLTPYLHTITKVLSAWGLYFCKLIFPLSVEPYLTEVPVNGWVGLSGLVFILLPLYLVRTFFRSWPHLAFSIIFYIFLLIPGVLISISSVSTQPLGERYLYLPSLGYCLIVASVLMTFSGQQHPWIHVLQKGVMCFVLILFSVLSFQRVKIWHDEITYWTHANQTNPLSSTPFMELGRLYTEQGDYEKAFSFYQKAFTAKSESTEKMAILYNNFGNLYFKLDRLSEAKEMFDLAMTQTSLRPETYYNLGMIHRRFAYMEKSNEEMHNKQAYEYLLKANRLDPYSSFYLFHLGLLMKETGNPDKSSEFFGQCCQVEPKGEWCKKAQEESMKK